MFVFLKKPPKLYKDQFRALSEFLNKGWEQLPYQYYNYILPFASTLTSNATPKGQKNQQYIPDGHR